MLYGKNLAQMLLDAAASARSMDEILAELDIQVDEGYIAHVEWFKAGRFDTDYYLYVVLNALHHPGSGGEPPARGKG